MSENNQLYPLIENIEKHLCRKRKIYVVHFADEYDFEIIGCYDDKSKAEGIRIKHMIKSLEENLPLISEVYQTKIDADMQRLGEMMYELKSLPKEDYQSCSYFLGKYTDIIGDDEAIYGYYVDEKELELTRF